MYLCWSEEYHTPVNAFFQAEELQALLLDGIPDICTPELTCIQTELFLRIRELRLLNFFLEKVKQATVRRNGAPMLVAILESVPDSHPYKIRNLGCNLFRNKMAVGRDSNVLALWILGDSFSRLCNGHDRIIAGAMDPVRSTISNVSIYFKCLEEKGSMNTQIYQVTTDFLLMHLLPNKSMKQRRK